MVSTSITGLGGCQEVGRSSFLLDYGKKILFDNGIKLGQGGTEYPLPIKTNLDGVVISHAHLDHSGNLPHLFTDSNFLCYMTPPTLDIAKILWFDTLKISSYEGIDPGWSVEEIRKTERFTFPLNYRRPMDITQGSQLEFFDAGHIIGSAMAKVSFGDKSFLYTGDFKKDETRLFSGADLDVGKVDYVAIESTYGDREHPSRKDVEKRFVEEVQDTIDRGGWALVPAFAVGRSQEIIEILKEYKVNAPVYFDGMGQKAARVMLSYPKYLKNHKFLKKALDDTVWVKRESFRKRALKEPSVIVTTAGMLQGGPAMSYLKGMYNDENSSVLLTGYQVEGTKGRILMDTKTIDIDNENYRIRGRVEKFDFSAHASQHEMLDSLKKWAPSKVFLIHGDKDVMPVFKEKIEVGLGIDTVILEAGKKTPLE